MAKFGYKLMSEEHGPRALVENAVRAEAAGFDFAAISDHFHPWLEAQGHAPFVWSVLGAIANATSTLGLATGLTCPIRRLHPAIIAQAAATVAVMSDNRFTLAVGTGEALNEHVIGERWPSVPERIEMLAEAIEVLRMLWEGGVQNHDGLNFTVNHARIYDLPDKPIPIVVGVSGEHSVEMALEAGDGMMTTSPDRKLVQQFRKGNKQGPVYGEVALAWAASEKAGRALAHERFRFSAFDWSVNAELPTVEGFEAATRFVKPEDLSEIPVGPDSEVHLRSIRKFLNAGFDHIALLGIGPDQEASSPSPRRSCCPSCGVRGR